MIKTYAEVLEERENMSNYDMDEIERQRYREKRAVESGLKITSIKDTTPMPHNGSRPPKKRRV